MQEPFLTLPAPNTNIIITPPRLNNPADESALVSLLNDPTIYPRLNTPPYPFKHPDANEFLNQNYTECQPLLKQLQQAVQSSGLVDGCPFRCIRDTDIQIEGRAKLIGIVLLRRYKFYELPEGSEERNKAIANNSALEVGGEGVFWAFADFLSPTHSGKGIMTGVIQTLIHQWAIPRMNAKTIKVATHVDNPGSTRVFEKSGFEIEQTLENWVAVPENKGGGVKSVHILRWGR